jgi:hypothetical protein
MADDPGVPKETVLSVLRAHKVDVSDVEGDASVTKIARNSASEEELQLKAYSLPGTVGRRMLHYLSRTYGVPVHHFYHPEMVSADTTVIPERIVRPESPLRIVAKAVNQDGEN